MLIEYQIDAPVAHQSEIVYKTLLHLAVSKRFGGTILCE